MAEIIPAILERTFGQVSDKLATVVGQARTVQLDICDGVFVPSLTWPFISPAQYDKTLNLDSTFQLLGEEKAEMPYWENFDFELDLMVADAKKVLPGLLAIGPSRVVFHAEAFSDVYGGIEELIRMMPGIVEPWIALGIGTDVSVVTPLLDAGLVKGVQCMGIASVGHQGEPLDEQVYTTIRELRTRYPELPISIDGGVTLDNAPKLVEAGATHLVAGSAIFTAVDTAARIAELKKVIQ